MDGTGPLRSRFGNTRMADLLFEAVAAHRQGMIALTRELIAIPSENPPGNCYSETAKLLALRLRELGFTETRMEEDCVLSFAGEGERTLYFSGHYDVVPAQSPSQFEPELKGANLFGRGSSDMKSGLAAMIYAALALREGGFLRDGRVGLVFVPDEETAGPRGSRHLAERGLLGRNAIGMLTPEPTGGVIWNGNRGAISLKITVHGKSAHVARQHEGINAFERMITVAQALQVLKAEVETAQGSILMLGGRTEGGTNFNVVPEYCSFTVDRRINPEEDFEREKQRLFEVLRGTGVDLDVEVLQEGCASHVAENAPLGKALARAVETVTGRAPKFEMCPGLLEIRFYAERGIPAFAYGPGLLTVSHGPNEFVPVERVVECAQAYALVAAELLGR